MSGEVAEAMGRHFTDRYPGIKVIGIRTTGQVAYERLMQELKNQTPQCDVFSSTDIAHYPALKARGALAHYEPVNAAALAPPFHGSGPGRLLLSCDRVVAGHRCIETTLSPELIRPAG